MSCAPSDSGLGDANINDQITRAGRVGEVLDDSEISSIHGSEEGTELRDHPVVCLGSTRVTGACANVFAVGVKGEFVTHTCRSVEGC